MAKATTGVNKSEAIRNALDTRANAKAKDIVEYLHGKGIDVTAGLVYQVKKTSKKKKAAKAPQAKAVAPTKIAAPSSNGHLGVGASIAVAKSAAEKVGGWAALKEIVDALQ